MYTLSEKTVYIYFYNKNDKTIFLEISKLKMNYIIKIYSYAYKNYILK